MFKELKHFTVRMVAGANVASIVIMLLVGFSDWINPANHPVLSNMGLLFPVFLFMNIGFLFFWLIFKPRYALLSIAGFIVCYVPVRKYTPFNMNGEIPEDAIKVLSYNVWGYGGNEVEDANEINPIITYLLEQDADIVCLQEAVPYDRNKRNQVDSILRRVYPYYTLTMHGGNGIAVLSKCPILSEKRIPYESQSNFSMAYRLKIGKKKVILINNHLQTTGLSIEDRQEFKQIIKGKMKGGKAEQISKTLAAKLAEATRKRAPQAEAVAHFIRQHKGESIILCGDFNDGPISYAHHTLARRLTDCYEEAGNGPGISYHRNGFYVRIDNIMCSDDWLPCDCKVDNKIADSDHYPIICRLKSARNL